MWNSLARSPLVTCLIHDRWLCEKPWMKRISGPFGLPQSCAEMVRPSGVFTETALNFGSCARPGAETAAAVAAAMMNVRTMDLLRVGMCHNRARSLPAVSSRIKLHRLPACAEGVRDVSSWHSTAVCCGAERRSRHARCDLFEQLQIFASHAVSNLGKAGAVAPGSR